MKWSFILSGSFLIKVYIVYIYPFLKSCSQFVQVKVKILLLLLSSHVGSKFNTSLVTDDSILNEINVKKEWHFITYSHLLCRFQKSWKKVPPPSLLGKKD